jgi:hypothetical protein
MFQNWLYTNNVWFSAGNTNRVLSQPRGEHGSFSRVAWEEASLPTPPTGRRGPEPETLEMEFRKLRKGIWNTVISACLKPHLPLQNDEAGGPPGFPVMNAKHLCMEGVSSIITLHTFS